MLGEHMRAQAATITVVILVLLAGCSGIGGSGTESPTATEESTPTAEGTDTTTTDDGASNDRESELSGRLLFVIDGTETHLETGSDASFWFNQSEEHTWHAAESMTLAEALEQAGVNATSDSLTYEGTTYDESDGNTTISYRVAGSVVEDPEEYELEDLPPNQEIVVRVDTGAERQVPGRTVDADHPHPHGALDVTIEGDEVDFSKEKYVKADEAFHFHGDENGSRWHGHSFNITVSYAISTFPGINLTNDTLTFEGTTYREDDPGTTITVKVNGEPVNPSTYILKDGDSISIEVNTSDDGS